MQLLSSASIKGVTALSLIFLLAGCGGDDDDGGTTPSTLSFPVGSAYKAFVASGYVADFTVSGDCSGSGNQTNAPATTVATFEGVTGLSAVTTFTMNLTNCTPAVTAQTLTNYYTNDYVPLGFNSPGVSYGVWAVPPTIPASVKVGDTAILGTINLYTDSTKTTPNGRSDQSYVVEANTSDTAIVNMISKVYSQSGTLLATEQSRMRIDAAGTLTPVSEDILYATSNTRLILTYY